MHTSFTIGSVSKQVGLPTKTIRFYEEIGLIKKAQREPNGYRMYPPETIQELVIIKQARDLGISIPQIRTLMVGCVDGNCAHTKTYVKKEIDDYTTLIEEKIHQLHTLKDKLHTLQKNMVFAADECDTYCCNILNQLTTVSKGGEK